MNGRFFFSGEAASGLGLTCVFTVADARRWTNPMLLRDAWCLFQKNSLACLLGASATVG